jgi:hypothetical protein
MDGKDRSYFEKRAEQELKAADTASDSRASTAHSLLAGFYLDLAHNGDARTHLEPPDETFDGAQRSAQHPGLERGDL